MLLLNDDTRNRHALSFAGIHRESADTGPAAFKVSLVNRCSLLEHVIPNFIEKKVILQQLTDFCQQISHDYYCLP